MYASWLADEADGSVRALQSLSRAFTGLGQVPPPPLEVSYISLTCDWGLIIVKLTVLIVQGDEADCVSTRFECSISSPFLVEEENNVGDVGNVAQSEKSLQKFQ